MLPTELLGAIVLFLICLVVLFQGIRQSNLEKRVEDAIFRLSRDNARSKSLRRMAEVEVSLTELTDAYDALMQSHKKLRSRIGMRAVREQRKIEEEAIPDSTTDPAGYKKAMRLKLAQIQK